MPNANKAKRIPQLKAESAGCYFMLNANKAKCILLEVSSKQPGEISPLNLVKTARLDLNPHGVTPRQLRSKVKLHTEVEVCNSILNYVF